ncbi:MAG: GAF domain-containing protein [bacterium]
MINDEKLRKLYSILSSMREIAGRPQDEVWDFLAKNAAAALSCEAATFFECDEKLRILTVKTGVGAVAADISNLSFAYQGICGWCAAEKKPVISNDVKNDSRFTSKVDLATGFTTKSVLCVPAASAGELFGVLELINPASGAFSMEDAELACFLAAYAVIFTRNIRLESTIKSLTTQGESVLQNLSGGFIGVDLNAAIMFFNPRARQILGASDEDYRGRPLSTLAGLCPEIVTALLETLRARKVLRRQEFTCLLSGASHRIGYSTLLMQDVGGNVAGAGITFQDITDAT